MLLHGAKSVNRRFPVILRLIPFGSCKTFHLQTRTEICCKQKRGEFLVSAPTVCRWLLQSSCRCFMFPLRKYRLCHDNDSVNKCGVCFPYESCSARER